MKTIIFIAIVIFTFRSCTGNEVVDYKELRTEITKTVVFEDGTRKQKKEFNELWDETVDGMKDMEKKVLKNINYKKLNKAGKKYVKAHLGIILLDTYSEGTEREVIRATVVMANALQTYAIQYNASKAKKSNFIFF